MMKKIRNSAGFGVVEIILGIVVLLLIVGAAAYVLKQKGNTSKTEQKTQASTFLDIKEWGVRLTVPKDFIGDMYYEKTKENMIGMSLKSIVAVASACAPNKTALVGGITRNKLGSYDKLSDIEKGQSVSKPFKTVGDYEFAFYHPQAACYDLGTEEAKVTAAYNGRTPMGQVEKDAFIQTLEAY